MQSIKQIKLFDTAIKEYLELGIWLGMDPKAAWVSISWRLEVMHAATILMKSQIHKHYVATAWTVWTLR